MITKTPRYVVCLLAAMLVATFNSPAADPALQLPAPDGKPADMSKPVQVFILMGQSNMLGFGKIGPESAEGSLEHAVKVKKRYPFLVDDTGKLG